MHVNVKYCAKIEGTTKETIQSKMVIIYES